MRRRYPSRTGTGVNRSRISVGFHFWGTALVLWGMLFSMLAGCAGTPSPNAGRSDRTVSAENNAESVLRELVRRFETRNTAGFFDFVHSGYEDTQGLRNDLRYRVSRVQDQYGNIDARVRVYRSTRRNARIVLETRWTLSWVCRTTGPGCYTNGETVERSGRSQFSFSRESGQWRLYRQEGAELFGSYQPGRVNP
jgi:hypothetical protein